jgi:hypothetical protein
MRTQTISRPGISICSRWIFGWKKNSPLSTVHWIEEKALSHLPSTWAARLQCFELLMQTAELIQSNIVNQQSMLCAFASE